MAAFVIVDDVFYGRSGVCYACVDFSPRTGPGADKEGRQIDAAAVDRKGESKDARGTKTFRIHDIITRKYPINGPCNTFRIYCYHLRDVTVARGAARHLIPLEGPRSTLVVRRGRVDP